MSNYRLFGNRLRSYSIFSLLLFAAGCGLVQKTPAPGRPAAAISPNPVAFPDTFLGASSSPIVVTLTDSAAGALHISSVAIAGSNPGDFINTNTCSGLVPSQAACTISITFTPTAAGPRSETITLTDNAADSPQVINVSGTANPIAITLTPQISAIAVSQSLQFTASGDPAGVTWSLAASTNSGPGAAAPAGSIDASGLYTPPPGSPSLLVSVTATSKTDPTKSASASVNVVAPGVFTATNNVQVAQYTVSTAASANVSVQFGLDTNYGLTTWTVPTPQLGGPPTTPLYVAGMKQSTPYHMRGVIQFADGTSFNDADQTFTTQALPAGTVPNITATTTPGMTPQSGVELLDLVFIGTNTGRASMAVTDLAGNVIWTYNPQGLPAGVFPNPIKLLPNGHFLIVFGGQPDGINTVIQEVDLAGNVIWQMTSADLNAALAAATCAECNVTIIGAHHDFQFLPNGHLILLGSLQETLPDGTTPTGDILIDLDQNHNVVWAWNEFNHLDTNRRPYLYPDWTHSNAFIYSPDDGNLIISIRHQNWLMKVPYENGAGSGDPIWRLGYQGDFALLNADGSADSNPFDWFYAQHGPSFASANTTGNYSLTLFDNGDDRGASVEPGGTCGVASNLPACFSTVPLLNLDETAMTATLAFHPTTPDYSFFGGNAEVLKNGNMEYDESASTALPANNASIFEVTQTSPPQTVWQMQVAGQFAYRAMRIPSLYPGVRW